MPTPSENMASRLEVLAAMLRHPSVMDGQFREIFTEFNAERMQYPTLLTDEELSVELKRAHGELDHMGQHPYREYDGVEDALSDRVQALENEHQRRFGR